MFVCLYKNYSDKFHAIGKTLDEAWQNLNLGLDGTAEFADCEFYEHGAKVEVELKVVPRTVIVESKKK